jgi:predicted dehydrogenase
MDRLKVAVIGVGALGRHHARILSTMPGVELVAVADPNPVQGQAVAESCRCAWTADFKSLVGQVDAASIVVPTSLHLRVAQEFLNAKIPVLIEKPLAKEVHEARAIVELADRQGIPLQVGHVERFNPAFIELTNGLCLPKYIRTERFSPYPFRSTDIGVVHDLLIHDIELVQHLAASKVAGIEAFGVCLVGGHEDCVQARLRFENGCIADLSANRLCPQVKRTIQVWSTSGWATADLQARSVTRITPGLPIQSGQLPFELAQQKGANISQLKEEMFSKFFPTETVQVTEGDALTMELSSFLDSVRTGKRPLVNGHDALSAVEVADEILKSMSQHAWSGSANGPVGIHALLPGHRKAA